MPMVIPLIAAGVSAWAGAAGAAALVAGTVTAASIAGGLMVAGAALTTIGTLSGNKTLSKWGGLVGLAGGVTGLASGAFGAASNSIASSTSESAIGTTSIGQSTGLGAEQLSQTAGAADVGDATGSLVSGSGGAAADAGAGSAALDVGAADGISAADGGSMLDSLGQTGASTAASAAPDTGIVGSQMAPAPAADALGAPAPAATGTSPLGTPMQGDPSSFGAPTASADKAALYGGDSYGSTSTSLLDKVKSVGSDAIGFIGDPKNARLVNTGAGLVKGAMENMGQQSAQQQKLKLEEEAAQRQRDRINASIKGLSVPVYKRAGA